MGPLTLMSSYSSAPAVLEKNETAKNTAWANLSDEQASERPLSVRLRDLSSGRKATGETRRERTTPNVRFQPELIVLDREMVG